MFDPQEAYFKAVNYLQTGKPDKAEKPLRRLLQLYPEDAQLLFLKALTLSLTNRKDEAINLYSSAIAKDKKLIDAYVNKGADLLALNRFHDAFQTLKKATDIAPTNTLALINLSVAQKNLNKLTDALHSIKTALNLKPDYEDAWINQGDVQTLLGNYSEAISSYKQAIDINPKCGNAYNNLATLYLKSDEILAAEASSNEALAIEPNNPLFLRNMGLILVAQNKLNDAKNVYHRSVQISGTSNAWCDYASILAKLGLFDEAKSAFKAALKISPNFPDALNGLGLAFTETRDFSSAIEFFSKAIKHDPKSNIYKLNRSIALLHNRNLEGGWIDYQYRWDADQFPSKRRNLDKPKWDKTNSTSGPIFIWSEQGLGDQILFCTLLNDFNIYSSEIIIQTEARLIPLMKRSYPNFKFIAENSNPPDNYKTHLPLGDLPGHTRNKISSFSTQPVKSLIADIDHSLRLRKLLPTDKLIIGISWETLGANALERNVPLEKIVHVLNSDFSCCFVDLQYTNTDETRNAIASNTGINIKHFDEIDNRNDLDALASLIEACDIVISCDNSVAHIAGALGKKTYLLVPFGRGSFWYWNHISEENNSLWYPTVRVIRQIAAYDWSSPLDELKCLLHSQFKTDLSAP